MRPTNWKLKSAVILGAAGAATAVLAQIPWTLPFAAIPQERQDGTVTFSGDTVLASEVFDQLRRAGANFVLDADAVPAGKKLTLHVVGKPAKAALQAVADALGLFLVERDGVYVLRKGVGGIAFVAPSGSGEALGWKGWDDESASKLREKFMGPGDAPRRFLFEFAEPGRVPMDLEELRKRFLNPGDGLEGFSFELGTPGAKGRDVPEKWSFRMVDGGDLRELARSLTPRQRELHEKQGFLRIGDLTPDQMKLLGQLSGKFEITFRDGETSLTVKSDD